MPGSIDPIAQNQTEITTKQWAEARGAAYVDAHQVTEIGPLVGLLDTKDMEAFHVVPLSVSPTTVNVGYTPTTDHGRLQFVERKFPTRQVSYSVISDPGLADLVHRLDLASLKSATSTNLEDFKAKLATASGETAFRMLTQVAYTMNASDIHIEPKQTEAQVRFRVDGSLHPIMTLPIDRYRLFLSAVQTLAHMQWGSDKPQQGRLTQTLLNAQGEQTQINVRLETVPTFFGEELIARLLSMDVQYLNLDNMNLAPHLRQGIDAVIHHPHGMILSVGPTGSGKTSMLYAMINKINSPELKIVTLEDPVEYILAGTSQIPVHSEDKESFADKLRAVLRQDPDVIMIGEVRDIDTAKTALQSSLTGHLVLSTFHANSAAAALSRLMDMVGQNPLLASALRMVMAQRLIRKLCTCKEPYSPDQATVDFITQKLANLPANIFKMPSKITLYKPKGCNLCNDFGYKGRFAIIEQLLMTADMAAFISSGQEATTQAIEALAAREGMVTLMQDGLMHVLAGDTAIADVYRSVES